MKMERQVEIKESSQQLLDAQVDDNEFHDSRSTDDPDVEGSHIQHRKYSRLRRWTTLITKGLILILILYGVLDLSNKLYSSWSSIRYSPSICDCGSSLAEAKEMGCQYVPLAAAYLPPHCRDPELEEEFDRSGPGINGQWAYYVDQNGTRMYTGEELAGLGGVGGDFTIYTTRAWHIVHCVYYWKKQIRREKTGAFIEPRFAGMKHVDHCLEEFLDPISPELIGSGQQISLTSSG